MTYHAPTNTLSYELEVEEQTRRWCETDYFKSDRRTLDQLSGEEVSDRFSLLHEELNRQHPDQELAADLASAVLLSVYGD